MTWIIPMAITVPKQRKLTEEYVDANTRTTEKAYYKSVVSYPSSFSLSNAICIYFNELDGGGTENNIIKDSVSVKANYSLLKGAFFGDDGDGASADLTVRNRHITAQTKSQSGMIDGLSAITPGLFDRKYKRTDALAWLPMPQQIQYQTSAGWLEIDADMGALGLLAKSMLSKDNPNSTAKDAVSMIGQEFFKNSADFIQEGLGSALTKSVQNTFQEQSFNGMQRRAFNFSWEFAPKSEDDLNKIDHVISLLRFHAHPDFSSITGAGQYLIFPGQIDVEFYTKDGEDYVENPWLPRLATCVIRNIDTNYTPNNKFSFFKNAGAATNIHLSISIQEITPITKTDIARGM